MVYTPLTKRAMKIAYEAHKNQLDKSGIPYIYHPIHVAEQCTTEHSCAAALLHDVVEDCSDYSFDRLLLEGIAPEVVEALVLLTHDKSTPYLEYVKNLSNNPIAREVKINDLKHNLDDTRLDDDIDKCVLEKLGKKKSLYRQALEMLENM